MKKTIQRQIILKTMQEADNHPTVEYVYQQVQKEYPAISKSTVYRKLHQLADCGEIQQVLIPDSPERFDGRLSRHYHFSCKKCGDIFDVDMDYVSGINETIQASYDFQVDEHDIIFKGICQKCKK